MYKYLWANWDDWLTIRSSRVQTNIIKSLGNCCLQMWHRASTARTIIIALWRRRRKECSDEIAHKERDGLWQRIMKKRSQRLSCMCVRPTFTQLNTRRDLFHLIFKFNAQLSVACLHPNNRISRLCFLLFPLSRARKIGVCCTRTRERET